MSTININKTVSCRLGPYRNYSGKAEFDPDTKEFYGEVVGTRDVITFQAPFEGIEQAFVESVDDYLQFCAERNESPDKPYSGRFVVRIPQDLHRDAAACAEIRGESLNQFVANAISKWL